MQHKITKFLIYFIIFSLPLYLVRFSVFNASINALDIMILMLFLLFLFKDFNIKKLFVKFKIENGNLLYTGIVLLFIGLILSTFLKSENILSSLGIIKSWFVLPIFFYIVVKNTLKTEKEKNSALIVLVFCGVLISIIGLIYFLTGNLTYDGRLQAFYPNPNMFAMILSIVVIIISLNISIGINTNKKNKKALTGIFQWDILFYLLNIAFYLLFFILLKTYSMGALLAVLIAILFYFYNIKYAIFESKNLKYIVFIFIIIMGAMLPFFSNFTNPWEMGRNSTSSRLMVWQASSEIIKDNFILGIGPADFQDKYLEYQKFFKPYLEWAVPHPHNIFVQIWLMGGIVGFLGFLFILIFFIKKIANYEFKIWNSRIKIIAIIILIYIILHGFVDNTIWKNDLAVIFWLLMALI